MTSLLEAEFEKVSWQSYVKVTRLPGGKVSLVAMDEEAIWDLVEGIATRLEWIRLDESDNKMSVCDTAITGIDHSIGAVVYSIESINDYTSLNQLISDALE